jgi:hypothetical protein
MLASRSLRAVAQTCPANTAIPRSANRAKLTLTSVMCSCRIGT